MRTTVDISDDMLRLAKEAAARRGITLSAIVSDALREVLTRRPPARREPRRLPAYQPKVPGVMPGVDIDDNAGLLGLLEDESRAAP